MATRSAVAVVSRCIMEGGGHRSSSLFPRYFSDGKGGRVLSEEERAKETVYIQKMERERLEKMKQKLEKEKADKGKEGEAADKFITANDGFSIKGGYEKSKGESHKD